MVGTKNGQATTVNARNPGVAGRQKRWHGAVNTWLLRSENSVPGWAGDAASRTGLEGFVVELPTLSGAVGVGTGVGGAFGLGDRPAQAGSDVVGIDLGDGALLALAGLKRAGARGCAG